MKTFIVKDEKILRQKSEEFKGSQEELQQIIKTLEFYLSNCGKYGVGLSGIQIGIPVRVAIIRTKTLNLDLYNTELNNVSDYTTFKGEGCLSIPDTFIDTGRFNKITIVNGDGKEYKLEGYDAIVVQHEMDHLDGILFNDRKII